MVKFFSAFFLLFLLFTAEVNAQVVINEFLPNPVGSDGGGNEWVEFYNSSGQEVDLSDFYFDDDSDFENDVGSPIIALSGVLQSGGLCFLSLSTYLNNDGDNPTLFDSAGISVDNYSYSSQTEGKSYSRIPDGGTWQLDQNPSKAGSSCVSLAASPTNTPSSTSTPSTAPSATLRIKEIKNDDGEVLSSVKIYINNEYTHHYAPEDINFCESCKCDSCDNQIDLKFGSYDIKLEKDGYQSWTDTRDIQSGNNVDIEVTLTKVAESTNTPTATKKPTSTPTKKKDINTDRNSPQPRNIREGNANQASLNDDDMVLGVKEEVDIEQFKDQEGVSQGRSIPLTAGVFIAGGLVLVVGASYPTIKTKLLEWGEAGNDDGPKINT